MNFPRRVVCMLDESGIKTISRLRQVINGDDDEFVGGLMAIPGMDWDSRDRTMAVFNDADDREYVPDTIPYHSPLSSPVVASHWHLQKHLNNEVRKVRIKLPLGDALPIGTIVEAMLIPSGQAIVQMVDEMEMLETGEFDIVE